jgi:pimeloyl-ACP methyl ester carboxylesterase
MEEEIAISSEEQDATSTDEVLQKRASLEGENPFVKDDESFSGSLLPEIKPEWQEDKTALSCSNPACGASFNLIRRRHHCRACGKIFCNMCCNFWIQLPKEFGFSLPERTCLDCMKNYSNLNYSKPYDIYGESNRPTILILHGALVNRMMHLYQIKEWSESYRVVAMDFPGHGSRRGESLTMLTAVEAVKQVIEAEVPSKKVLLFGYDLGGYVALEFSSTYPEMCAGLVLGGCSNETFGGSVQLLFGALRTAYLVLPESTLWSLIPSSYSHIPKESFNETILRSGMNYAVWGECAEAMKEPRPGYWISTIASFDGPIFLINGELDDRKAEDKFYESCKNGRLHTMKRATHLGHIEPETVGEFNQMVLEFARSITWQ